MPTPGQCQSLHDEVAQLEKEIEDLEGALDEVPPNVQITLRQHIVQLTGQLLRKQAKLRTCEQNQYVIMLSSADLELGPVRSMAVNADATRVYFGGWNSTDSDRLNLGVATLDIVTGVPVGETRFYPDSAIPRRLQYRSSVVAMVVDTENHGKPSGSSIVYNKLYVAVDEFNYRNNHDEPIDNTKLLTVYDLNAQGDPTGKPRSYEYSDNDLGTLPSALARHPTLPILFLAAYDSKAKVCFYALDPDGNPVGLAPTPLPLPSTAPGYSDIAVSQAGDRLYLGTSSDQLEVVDLDPAGLAALDPARIVALDSAGKPRWEPYFAGPARDHPSDYLQFHYTPQALYRRQRFNSPPDLRSLPPWPLIVWHLGSDGRPHEIVPKTFPLPAPALGPDSARRMLWLAEEDSFPDAFTGELVVDGATAIGVPLDDSGDPLVTSKQPYRPPRYRHDGYLTAVSAKGPAVMLALPMPSTYLIFTLGAHSQVRGYRVRVTILDVDPGPANPTPPTLTWTLTAFPVSPKPPTEGSLSLLQTSEAILLDPFLKDHDGQASLILTVSSSGTTHLDGVQVRLDFYHGNAAGGSGFLKSLTDTVRGNVVQFLVPGYCFLG